MKKILYIVLIICLVVGLTATSCKAYKKDLNKKYLDGYYCDFGGKNKTYRIQFGEVKK